MDSDRSMNAGFSPCPNDTFIFDAIINRRIDTEGFNLNPIIADVEELNRKAFSGELPITKLSYSAYGFLSENYIALNSGSALGNGCGPLLITREENLKRAVNSLIIGIPGRYTTANLLLGLAYPEAQNRRELLFSNIESAVLNGEVDAGLLIHENRFTYRAKGLVKIADLGLWWEEEHGLPIPLGGIFIRRNLARGLQSTVDRLIRTSVEYAIRYPEKSKPFIKRFAAELDDRVIDQHIALYVNRFSVDLGGKGREAITALFKLAAEKKIIPAQHRELFVQ